MPGLDGTGPMGQGSMTGRGMGRCNPNASGSRNFFARFGFGRRFGGRGFGRGFGMGFGRGRGFVNGGVFPIEQNPEDELEALKAEKKLIDEEISRLEKESKGNSGK